MYWPHSGPNVLSRLILIEVKGVEAVRDPGRGTVKQRPVVALDHQHAGAHESRKLEDGNSGRERVGGERQAEVIDPRWPGDPACVDGGCPLPAPGVVEIEQTARRRREQQRGTEARRRRIKRSERALG